jgi:hypothetical protein
MERRRAGISSRRPTVYEKICSEEKDTIALERTLLGKVAILRTQGERFPPGAEARMFAGRKRHGGKPCPSQTIHGTVSRRLREVR